MPEIEEKTAVLDFSKKQRIVKVAKELHVSVESLVEFLQEEGYKVKNHMSVVTLEMYDKINEKYKKPALDDAEDADELDFQSKAEMRREKEQERIDFIRREIQEITDSKVLSLDEVQAQAIKKAEEEAKRREEEKQQRAEAKKKALLEEEQLKKAREEEKAKAKEKAKEKPKAKTKAKAAEEVAKKDEKAEIEAEAKSKPKDSRLERLLDVEVSAPPPERIEEPITTKKKPEPEVTPEEEAKVLEEEPEIEKVAEPEETEVEVVSEKVEAPKVEAPEQPVQEADKEGKKEKKKKKRDKKRKVSEEDVSAAIRKTMASMDDKGKPKRRKKSAQEQESDEEVVEGVIKVSEYISVAELAREMNAEVNEVITTCLEMGQLVSINQRLDMDTIIMISSEFGFEVEEVEAYGQELIEDLEEEDVDPSKLEPRPPIITIMGHVDHGKTSLLDYIRNSNIIAGEVGGITQHIGAYVVNVDGKKITFLDTPGHEAFTAMRARGAQVTDIVVLVVAADDKVMPQTIEAINHARAANVAIIVAINKIDKDGANIDQIKTQLSEQDILVEDWGGKYPVTALSAKTGENVDHLLELLVLQAEILELKADPKRQAKGVVVEAELDRGRGPVATVLVREGSIKVGAPIIAGSISGKVRAMFDERGKPVKVATPSTPVQVLGFDEVPTSGDAFHVLKSERIAKEISVKRQQLKREQDFRSIGSMTLDEFSQKMRERGLKELNLIVKADVDGSIEALSDSLLKLGNEEVSVKVIHKSVGEITENDVIFALASQAIIIGLHIRPNAKARATAEKENVDIRTYEIIYDAINDVEKALEGLLEPEEKEEIIGVAEVRETFRIPKVGLIAGSFIQSGKIIRNDKARVIRDGVTVYQGLISSLKRFKDDVKEVQSGYECGIGIQDFNDIKVGDTLESFQIVKTKAKLGS